MLRRTQTGLPRRPALICCSTRPIRWTGGRGARRRWPRRKRTNKPILLSVGYAACHWCHVMAHESFEDEATAARHERAVREHKSRPRGAAGHRPDLHERPASSRRAGRLAADDVSQLPTASRSGAAPIFRRPRNMAARLCRRAARSQRASFARAGARSTRIAARWSRGSKERGQAKSAVSIGTTSSTTSPTSIARATDPVHGGLRGAPKFPQCTMLEFIWRAGFSHRRRALLQTTQLALTQMSQGGIYDHLGGGYARYSVDEKWLVPHFEKMLYDNAQILDLLALDYARTQNPLYRERATETVGWLRREMKIARGRLRVLAGCRFGRRGGQILCLVARRDLQDGRSGAPSDGIAPSLLQNTTSPPRQLSKDTISQIASMA